MGVPWGDACVIFGRGGNGCAMRRWICDFVGWINVEWGYGSAQCGEWMTHEGMDVRRAAGCDRGWAGFLLFLALIPSLAPFVTLRQPAQIGDGVTGVPCSDAKGRALQPPALPRPRHHPTSCFDSIAHTTTPRLGPAGTIAQSQQCSGIWFLAAKIKKKRGWGWREVLINNTSQVWGGGGGGAGGGDAGGTTPRVPGHRPPPPRPGGLQPTVGCQRCRLQEPTGDGPQAPEPSVGPCNKCFERQIGQDQALNKCHS